VGEEAVAGLSKPREELFSKERGTTRRGKPLKR
jgi:hypothetical protein